MPRRRSLITQSKIVYLLLGLLIGFLFGTYKYSHNISSNYNTATGECSQDSKDFLRMKNILFQERLNIAESIWKQSVEARHSTLNSINLSNPRSQVQGVMFWDYFYPSFDCPFHVERIGRVGEGGKWVCGFQHLITKSLQTEINSTSAINSTTYCIVYSFGVGNEVTFEEEILTRTIAQEDNNFVLPCIIHMYDPTIDPTKNINVSTLLAKYNTSNRLQFHQIGLGASNNPKTQKTLKLSTLMKQNGHDWIDILKIDIEGHEYDVLEQIVQEFGLEKLPFGQLQLELHFNKFKASIKEDFLEEFVFWFELLESAGLRAFHREPNYLITTSGQTGFILRFEYSFINVKNRRNPLLYE